MSVFSGKDWLKSLNPTERPPDPDSAAPADDDATDPFEDDEEFDVELEDDDEE